MLKRFRKIIANIVPGGFENDCFFTRKDFAQNLKLHVAPEII